MASSSLTIWCNYPFKKKALTLLKKGLKNHHLILPKQALSYRLNAGSDDQVYPGMQIALGQPEIDWIEKNRSLQWIHLTSAGYTRFDKAAVRAFFKKRSLVLTNSSRVFNEPCAEHALAMIMAFARQLPAALSGKAQKWECEWLREHSFLLKNQTILILGFGAIGERLTELLAPFGIPIFALKRKKIKKTGVTIISARQLSSALAKADHVVNILPENEETTHFCNAAFFRKIKRGAYFYNIGRGATVNQTALEKTLKSGRLAGAYLDVTDPEPLPLQHPLWKTPNCFITPHTAGGHFDEDERLALHFLENLKRFTQRKRLNDVVF